MIKEILKDAFSLKNDTASHDEIKKRIVNGGQVTGTNMCVLILAILIASIGLNMNSTAVIIGAMLISPLMGSILAIAYGTASVDLHLFRKSIIGFIFQIALSLLASTLYFALSPISTTTSELLARTQPTIWDVLIAICGGLAGIIGITREEKSNVIPGVAIATALMPPLCTCGYAIANGQWRMMLGAGYLFLVNTYFIFLSSAIVLLILEVPKVTNLSEGVWKRLKKGIIRNTIIMIIPSLVFAYFMVQSTKIDEQSLTGFEDSIATESVIAQIEILFPEIETVKIGTVEQKQKDGEITCENVIVLDREDKLSAEKTHKLQLWLKEVYQKDYEILYAHITEDLE